jgi:uncharacterized membrane protein YraQ (UPF0718 family)/copper chaperone CopZ
MAEAMAPWLLFGFAASGLLHSFLPLGWIRTHLSQDGLTGVMKAALIGTPLPICSCGVIPVANWLRKEGASRGATMSFLVSTPVTGVDSILATLAMMGGLFAGIRPLVAMISGVLIGFIVSRMRPSRRASEVFSVSTKSCADGCNTVPSAPDEMPAQLKVRAKTFRGRLREALDYGFVELVADIAKWLVIGLAVGGAISAFVPSDFLANAGYWDLAASYFFVLIIGIPLYVCATGSIPIAAALVAKGVSPGAALIFLIAGPATNVATIAFVNGTFGKRVLAVYLGGIAGVGLLAGLLLDLFAPQIILGAVQHHHGGDDPFAWVATASAVVLCVLLIPFFLQKLHFHPKETAMPQTTLSLPSISCGNCARHVDKIGRSIFGIQNVNVDIVSKTATFTGTFDADALKQKLAEEGYPPT